MLISYPFEYMMVFLTCFPRLFFQDKYIFFVVEEENYSSLIAANALIFDAFLEGR